MNKRLIVRLAGRVLLVESALMAVPLVVSFLYGDGDHMAFIFSMAITCGCALLTSLLRPQNETLRAREGFSIVALSWIAVSFFGGLPFCLSGRVPSLIDSVFEAASGFTTTGATILKDIEGMSRSLLFWRSFTHWAGGMGVLVLSLALIPKMGARSVYLMRAESAGPAPSKLVPRVGDTAKILYQLYIGLSLLLTLCLLLCGLSLYDALLHTFSTAGTGGFSCYSASVGHYDSAAVDVIISVFMILFGLNFALFFYLRQRNWKAVIHNSEARVFVCVVSIATLLVTVNIFSAGFYDSFGGALRRALFQVSSIISTTGFCTADFNTWPLFSKCILVALMFIGGCAGSTAGGVKVIRMQILTKSMVRDVRRTVHPKGVFTVKIDRRSVEESIISSVQGYFFTVILLLVSGSLVLSLDGYGFETTVTAAITTLFNVGPGLDLVGPTGGFSMFSPVSKIVLTMWMIIGRLEIFPILMLFSPTAWRK